MPRVKVKTGVSLYYEVHGEGEPLLLILGTGASHKFWSAQLPAYSREFETIIYDARGMGQADAPPPPYTMRMLAEDAVSLLDELGVARAHISGISLGSATAQEIAINYPERVISLQLHSTWGRSDEWFKRMIDTLQLALEKGGLRGFARTALMWVMSPRALEERKEMIADLERALAEEYPPKVAGLLGQFDADRTHDASARLHMIKAPTLITCGEMDWQVPIRYGQEVHERIPGASIHIFRGPYSSHSALFEMAEVFNAFTLAFLCQHSEHKEKF